jgi:hypothetical protein
MSSNESAIRKRKHIKSSIIQSEDKIESTEKHEKDEKYLKDFDEEYSNLQPKRGQYHLTRIVLVRFIGFIYGRIHA